MAQLGLDSNVFNAQAAMQLPTRELGGLAQSRLGYLEGLTPNLDISPDFATPNIDPNQGGSGLTWNGPSTGYNWNNTGSGNPNAPSLAPTTYNGTVAQYGGTSAGAQGPAAATGGANTSNPWGVALPGTTGGDFGSLSNPYNAQSFTQDPGYAFDVQQGTQGLNRAAAAGGQLGSGASLKAAINYATGMASNEFNSAYQRSQQTNTNTFNQLSALAGSGQTATTNTGAAAGALGTSGSSALAGYGNAGAAGAIGVGNAQAGAATSIGNTIGTLGSQYFNSQNPTYNPYNTPNPYAAAPYNPPTMSAGGGYTWNTPGVQSPD